jgi:hypothetical protein
MATVKLTSEGKVILKDGKVSCSCCDPCSNLAATYTVSWTGPSWADFTGTHVFERVAPCEWEKLHGQCELWGDYDYETDLMRPPNFAGEFGYVDFVSLLSYNYYNDFGGWCLAIQTRKLEGSSFPFDNCSPVESWVYYLYQVSPDLEDPTGLYLDEDGVFTAIVS